MFTLASALARHLAQLDGPESDRLWVITEATGSSASDAVVEQHPQAASAFASAVQRASEAPDEAAAFRLIELDAGHLRVHWPSAWTPPERVVHMWSAFRQGECLFARELLDVHLLTARRLDIAVEGSELPNCWIVGAPGSDEPLAWAMMPPARPPMLMLAAQGGPLPTGYLHEQIALTVGDFTGARPSLEQNFEGVGARAGSSEVQQTLVRFGVSLCGRLGLLEPAGMRSEEQRRGRR